MAGYDRAAPFYDTFTSDDDLDLFTDYASGAGVVLDVAANTRRVAVPMAQAGCELTCIGPPPAIRAKFEEKLAADPDLAEDVIPYPIP